MNVTCAVIWRNDRSWKWGGAQIIKYFPIISYKQNVDNVDKVADKQPILIATY